MGMPVKLKNEFCASTFCQKSSAGGTAVTWAAPVADGGGPAFARPSAGALGGDGPADANFVPVVVSFLTESLFAALCNTLSESRVALRTRTMESRRTESRCER